ncbi:MAG: hypothetical protein V8T01_05300 [Oscillospiraceae bacterium]
MKKRIIAFLLAAVLLLGLMPTALAAEPAQECTVTLKNSEGEDHGQIFDSKPRGYAFSGWYNGDVKLTEETVIKASPTRRSSATLSTPYHMPTAAAVRAEGWYLYDETVKLQITSARRFKSWTTSSRTADFEGKTVGRR